MIFDMRKQAFLDNYKYTQAIPEQYPSNTRAIPEQYPSSIAWVLLGYFSGIARVLLGYCSGMLGFTSRRISSWQKYFKNGYFAPLRPSYQDHICTRKLYPDFGLGHQCCQVNELSL